MAGLLSPSKDKPGSRRSQEQLCLLREACWVNMWTQGHEHSDGLPNTLASNLPHQWELLAFLHRETKPKEQKLCACGADSMQTPEPGYLVLANLLKIYTEKVASWRVRSSLPPRMGLPVPL